MRTQILIISIILCFTIFLMPYMSYGQQEYFYSTNGQKVYLDMAKDRFGVKPAASLTAEQIAQALENSFTNVRVEEVTGLSSEGFYEIRFDSGSVTKQQLATRFAEMRTDNAWEVVNPVYLIEGSPAIVYDIFVVNLSDEGGLKELDELNKQYGVELVDRNELVPTMITLRMHEHSEYQVTELARLYYESLDMEWSTPDFKQEIILHGIPNDPYYQYQFYMDMIWASDAWDISLGSETITVAVVDEGVEAHPDLPAGQLVNGYDAFDPINGDGSPGGNQAHGMASAGIIGANHNTQGVAGLSPNIEIMPIRIFDERGNGTGNNDIATAMTHAVTNGADIISNSWGYGGTGDVNPQLTTVIENAMQNGRGGNGTIIIFSSGNSGNAVRYPANLDGVIAVGAVEDNDTVWGYSCRGPELDLVAPSGDLGYFVDWGPCGQNNNNDIELRGNVWSLDRSNNPGWNTGNNNTTAPNCFHQYTWTAHAGQATPANGYTAHFGGTSAAAPQVSGVAALMLSINPDLTLDQLRDVLQNTADEVAGMNGLNFTNEYGFGRLNVYEALINTMENHGAHLGTELSQVRLPLYDDLTLQEDVSLESGSNLTIESESGTVTVAVASGTVTIGGPGGASKIVGGSNSGEEDTGDNDDDTTEPETTPKQYSLSENYPNPFNPVTVIRYQLPVNSDVTLKVFDLLGRNVATLVDGQVSSGQHEVRFDASNLSSGIYIYRIRANDFVETRQMTLIK